MKKLLIVEDSQPVRQNLCDILGEAGYDVVSAVDGLDGLDKMRDALDLGLVLCDVNMPRMGGIDLLEEVKRSGVETPFIMLTSEAVPALMRRARNAGAAGWVIKPVKAALLVSVVNKIIGSPT